MKKLTNLFFKKRSLGFTFWVYGVLGTIILAVLTPFLLIPSPNPECFSPSGDVLCSDIVENSFFMWISFLIIFIAFSLIQTFKACTSIGKAFFFSSIQLLVSVIIISAVWLTSFVIIMNYPYAFF